MYNPYYWTDELIPYGNNGSLDPEFWTKYLLGGWTNPEKYACQIGSFPPNWWVKINNLLKPPKLESLKKTITSCAAGAPPGRLLGEEEVQFEKDYLHLRIPRCEHLDFPVSPKFVANPQCLFHNRATVFAREVVGKVAKYMNPGKTCAVMVTFLGIWHLPKKKNIASFYKITDFSLNQVFWLVLRLWDTKLFLNI